MACGVEPLAFGEEVVADESEPVAYGAVLEAYGEVSYEGEQTQGQNGGSCC